MTMQRINIEMFGDLHCTADINMQPADIAAIKGDVAASARYAAATAINTLAEIEKNNAAWTGQQKQAVAMETAACVLAAIHAMQ